MKWTKKKVKVAALTAVTAFVVVTLWSRRDSGHDVPEGMSPPPPRTVQLISVEAREARQTLEATGVVRPRMEVPVASKVPGRIVEVLVREGDRVRAGQTLIRLDRRDLDAAVAQASANRRAASTGVDNAVTAAEMEQSVSQARIAQASAAVRSAEAAAQSARARREMVRKGPRAQERRQADLAVAQARSGLTLAESNLRRMESLHRQGAVARQQLEMTQSEYEVAKAQHDAAVERANMVEEGSRTEEIRAADEAVRQADAGLGEARAALKEARAAALQVSVRRQQIRGARAQEGQSAAAVRMAEVTRDETNIVAPYDGVVTSRLVDPGAFASPGVPLLVVQGGALRLEAVVPESVLSSVRVGDTAPVRLDALPGRALTGRVVEIAPSGDAASHTFRVKVEIPSDSGVKPGMFGRAAFSSGSAKRVLVPAEAVIEREGLRYVFVSDEDHARLRLVTIGEETAAGYTVLSGLSPGDRVVKSAEGLEDGAPIVDAGGFPNMKLGFAGKLAAAFINSKLTPLIIISSLLLGAFAVKMTPREEEPQIIVPMMDVFVEMPGATAKDVERRVTTPMEKLIWEVPGVEYLYSTSMPGMAQVIVRFYVGQNEEDSLVRLREKLQSHFDIIPPGAGMPIIKPHSIDDVPILALTLHSRRYGPRELRQIAARVDDAIKQVNNVSETTIIGGRRREVRVTLDRGRLTGYNLTPAAVSRALGVSNQQGQAGSFAEGNQEIMVKSGGLLRTAGEVEDIVVGAAGGRPVFLRDVATVEDGPADPDDYVFHGFGPAHAADGHVLRPGEMENAVTISVAKRKGKNAITIAENVIAKAETLKGTVIPADVELTISRNYGETASEKSGELLYHMLIAVVSVTLLIAFALGRRESLVVAVAIPVTLALTLLVFYLYGYTLNRITLFALIFSIGILVDDAIVVVENIVRHYRLPNPENLSVLQRAILAVDEVGNPTILATFTVIAAILPMAFVGGLMGPYMRPIPVGASAAMIFSLLIAFIVTPWAGLRILKDTGKHGGHGDGDEHANDALTRLYRKIMDPLLHSSRVRLGFFLVLAALMAGAVSLVPLKAVTVKMLPFDNKNEFQIIVDMPNGVTLEQTAAATRALAAYVATVPEVEHYQAYIGTASPYNFNGLVRHYFIRSLPHQADIQVNLAPKHHREEQSHAIARRIRPDIERIAREWGVRVKIAEVPPGPPVLQTLVAEVYGPSQEVREQVAAKVKEVFHSNPGVTDVDWYVEDDQPTVRFIVDQEKAALLGVDTASVNGTLQTLLSGSVAGLVHDTGAREDVPIVLRLPRSERSGVAQLSQVYVSSASGAMVPLAEVVRVEEVPADKAIYHKNLMPVTYVTGDVTGRQESPVYAILAMNRELRKLEMPGGGGLQILSTRLPFTDTKPAMKWDGEWHITYEVFRDLGIAFAAVMVLIYILVVAWFQNYKTPLVIMAPIPLTLVGILPGHAMMGAFFTATSMIGFIAGAGIIVRNSIILVDFIELRLKQGYPLDEAVIDAGATRFRPMLLTAAAVIAGSFVILFDPIFQGLAISLMAGEVASTLLSRLAVPVLYYMMKSREARGGSTISGAPERPAPESAVAAA